MSINEFYTEGYQRINRARQEHLARLGLSLQGKSVLELGAGIGDHTQFWLDRGCQVTSVEGRLENAKVISARYPDIVVTVHDLDSNDWPFQRFDIVYAYGVLYHLKYPESAIASWSYSTKELLLLETVISKLKTTQRPEDPNDARAGLSGEVTWLSRKDLEQLLQLHFNHVYSPIDLPDHYEFRMEYSPQEGDLLRRVYVASRTELKNPRLRLV